MSVIKDHWIGGYELDETIPVLYIEFKKLPEMCTGEIELSGNHTAILRTRGLRDGSEDGAVEIIDIEAFMNAPETDDIEVEGFNVKELAREALMLEQVDDLSSI